MKPRCKVPPGVKLFDQSGTWKIWESGREPALNPELEIRGQTGIVASLPLILPEKAALPEGYSMAQRHRAHESRMANAHLIAASPDLLYAARLAQEALVHYADGMPEPVARAIEALRDAITKAEGC